jgi:hypothetical protein
VRARRARANVVTQLDAERDRLRSASPPTRRWPSTRSSWPSPSRRGRSLRGAADAFVQAGGDPRRARDQQTAAAIQFLRESFPAAADREWLRVFAGALEDERARAYHQEWLALQRDRSAALAAAESTWQRAFLPRLGRFLNGTRQPAGELLLSPGHRRGGAHAAGRRALEPRVVAFPERAADAADAGYVATHELAGSLVGQTSGPTTTSPARPARRARRPVRERPAGAAAPAPSAAAPDSPGYAPLLLREAGLARRPPARRRARRPFPLPAASSTPHAAGDAVQSGI